MPWCPLPLSNIWPWTLHQGLPWTIYACMYSSGMVSTVSFMFIPIMQWALTNEQLDGPKQWSRWRNISLLQQGAYWYASINVQVGSTLGWIWADWGYCGEPFILLLSFVPLIVLLHSHLQATAPMLTYMNSWLQTCYTSSSRGCLSTILLLGLSVTLRPNIRNDKQIKFSMT